MTPHIAVLGGGLAGRLTALGLVRQGFRVSLFCRGSRAGETSAAYAAAAMLAPAAEAADATPQAVALGRQSMALWRKISDGLGTPVMMQQNGSLIVWHGQDRHLAAQFRQRLERACGRNAAAHWNAAQIADGEPQLAGRFSDGLYLPGEGQLDGRQMLSALARALETAGAACHWQSAREPSGLAGFDLVADCRGFGAKNDWNRPSENGSRLRGVRGEVARVQTPEVSLNRPVRLLHPRYPLYIAPKENHVFVIGATQLESESPDGVGVRSGLELLSALYAVHPAFGEAQILELSAALRPALGHHNPEIRFDRRARLIEINGLFRHGFMIAPAVTAAAVRLAAALCGGGAVPEYDAESGLPYIAAEQAV